MKKVRKKVSLLIVGLLGCLLLAVFCACDSSAALESISVTTAPAKTVYVEGETFDPAGMVVTARYSDGSEGAVTEYSVSPSGALTVADTSVTISYTENGVTETATQAITVTPAAAVLESIAITTEPTTKVYFEGQTFDPTGMVVTAYFDDDSAVAVTDYTYSPSGALTVSDEEITVSYTAGGVTKAAVQQISVQARQLVGIRIAAQPTKTAYVDGEAFDDAGMVVEGAYNDGSSVNITDYTVDKETLSLGDTSVTVQAGGFEATVSVTVEKSVLESITAVYDKDGAFVPDETIEESLFTVTATHGTGGLEKKYVVTDFTFTPETIEEDTEEIVVSYSYGDVTKTASIPVTVKLPETLTFTGTATTQRSGYPFDADGLTFTLEYSTGDTEPVDVADITFGEVWSGAESIVAEYLGLDCEIPVTVESVATKSVAPDVATYVQNGVTAANREPSLVTNATNVRISFLSFDYRVSAQDIDRAILQLTVKEFETKQQDRPFRDYYRTLTLYAVPYASVTADMEWASRPTEYGVKVAELKVPPIVDYVMEVDITDYVKENIAALEGRFAFALLNETDTKTDKSTFRFYDGSSAEHAPALLFTKDYAVASVSAPATFTVNVGASLPLGAAVQPFYASDASLSYESDNPQYVTVSQDGVVTGVAEGSANITVKAANGQSATVAVTVNAAVANETYEFKSAASAYVQMWDKGNAAPLDTLLKTQISCQSASMQTSLGNERRSFLSVDFSELLGVGEVKSATLTLYLGETATHTSFKGDRHVDVDIINNIDVESVTYWDQKYTSDEYLTTFIVADGATVGTEYTIDLTDYINAHLHELNGVITLMLCNRTEYLDATGGGWANFYSSRADEQYRPSLTIEV